MTVTGTTGQTRADRRTVVGVFDGPNHAEQALNELRNAGFSPEQVSVVARDNRETREMVENTEMGAEGAASGALLGGLTGGVIGWLVGISALVIPGIGPIVGAGVLLSTLVGAGIGAATGGLVGALVDHGVPEDEARGYEDNVRKGSILLTVHAQTDQQAHQAHDIFDRHGGGDVRAYGVAPRGSHGAAGRRGDDASAGDEIGAGIGGAAGAVTGGVIGSVAGPVGTAAGAAIGGAVGGGLGHAAGEAGERDSRETSGAGAATGGAAGAVVGGVIGSVAGPVGTAAGAAIGGAVGAGGGSELEDKAADETTTGARTSASQGINETMRERPSAGTTQTTGTSGTTRIVRTGDTGAVADTTTGRRLTTEPEVTTGATTSSTETEGSGSRRVITSGDLKDSGRSDRSS